MDKYANARMDGRRWMSGWTDKYNGGEVDTSSLSGGALVYVWAHHRINNSNTQHHLYVDFYDYHCTKQLQRYIANRTKANNNVSLPQTSA